LWHVSSQNLNGFDELAHSFASSIEEGITSWGDKLAVTEKLRSPDSEALADPQNFLLEQFLDF
jgi:hypothetical protein